MIIDPMFWLALAAFAWGLSLASYRWFAIHNGWPMGEWQAHRPGLPIAIGLFAMLFAMLFAFARGGITVMVLPIAGLVAALLWTAVTRVGAQIALLLAPIAVIALLAVWMTAASTIGLGSIDERLPRDPVVFSPSQGSGSPGMAPGQPGGVPSVAPAFPTSGSGPTAAPGAFPSRDDPANRIPPAATDRDGRAADRDRGITFDQQQTLPPAKR